MTRLATKKGIAGILYRTKAPKFEVDKPTEKAKNKLNETQKNKSG